MNVQTNPAVELNTRTTSSVVWTQEVAKGCRVVQQSLDCDIDDETHVVVGAVTVSNIHPSLPLL